MGRLARARPRSSGLFIAGLLFLAGCDEEDPLDVEVLGALAVDEGTATGSGRSGNYGPVDAETLVVALESCDCPDVGEANGCDLVAGLEATTDVLAVLQIDGFVRISYRDVELTGPLDADGSMAAASVRDESNFLYTARTLARLDARFEQDTQGTRLSGTLQQRLEGELLGDRVDCRASFRVTAVR